MTLRPGIGAPDAILGLLADGAARALGEDLVGLYVVGSFALGAADEWSDLDFLAVTRERLTPGQELALRDLHAVLPDAGVPFADHLEGSYAPLVDLRSPMSVGRSWLYVDNGARDMAREMTWSDHDNQHHTRWVLRERGIAVTGPAPSSLLDAVPPAALRAEAVGVARSLGEWIENDRGGLADAWAQPFVVLTACRALVTAVEARVAGKAEAVEFALPRVPAEHRPVLERALASRPDPWNRVGRPADPAWVAPTRAAVWELHRLVGEATLSARES